MSGAAAPAQPLLLSGFCTTLVTNPCVISGRYELYLRQQGEWKHAAAAALVPPIAARIEAVARYRYACPECHVCSVLLRRYFANGDERRGVPSHFDRMAYVTAVASLNDDGAAADGDAGGRWRRPAARAFDGGLFVQARRRTLSRAAARCLALCLQRATGSGDETNCVCSPLPVWRRQAGEHVRTRSFVRSLRGGGDVVFHSYDLNHGVQVTRGERFSAIFWVTDSAASCVGKVSPWYLRDAAAGNADAQDALAELYTMGEERGSL